MGEHLIQPGVIALLVVVILAVIISAFVYYYYIYEPDHFEGLIAPDSNITDLAVKMTSLPPKVASTLASSKNLKGQQQPFPMSVGIAAKSKHLTTIRSSYQNKGVPGKEVEKSSILKQAPPPSLLDSRFGKLNSKIFISLDIDEPSKDDIDETYFEHVAGSKATKNHKKSKISAVETKAKSKYSAFLGKKSLTKSVRGRSKIAHLKSRSKRVPSYKKKDKNRCKK